MGTTSVEYGFPLKFEVCNGLVKPLFVIFILCSLFLLACMFVYLLKSKKRQPEFNGAGLSVGRCKKNNNYSSLSCHGFWYKNETCMSVLRLLSISPYCPPSHAIIYIFQVVKTYTTTSAGVGDLSECDQ